MAQIGSKQLRKGKSSKLAEVTAARRHPREGRPELDGQVVRQKQGEGNYENTGSTPTLSKCWVTSALAKTNSSCRIVGLTCTEQG